MALPYAPDKLGFHVAANAVSAGKAVMLSFVQLECPQSFQLISIRTP